MQKTVKKEKKMSGKTPIYDVPEALKRKILPGFTCIEHGIDAMSWSGFGWFGKLQVEIDEHNTGAATIELKNATDKFFYLETLLGNGGKIILHVGRYKSSQKLYLYHASDTLPVYVQNPQ